MYRPQPQLRPPKQPVNRLWPLLAMVQASLQTLIDKRCEMTEPLSSSATENFQHTIRVKRNPNLDSLEGVRGTL